MSYHKVLTAVLICASFSLFGESSSFDELDTKIVNAFNASPKNTAEVYLHASEMIALANKLSSSNSQRWRDKAQELITLSAYNEAEKAYSKGNMKQALIWCERGTSSGAKQGKIADYNIGDFYKMTLDLKQKTEDKLKDKNESFSKHEISHLAKTTADITNPKKNREEDKRPTYKLVKGPLQDSRGVIFVIVNIQGGGNTRISFTKDKGWSSIDTGGTQSQYFPTWYDCAKSLKQGNLEL